MNPMKVSRPFCTFNVDQLGVGVGNACFVPKKVRISLEGLLWGDIRACLRAPIYDVLGREAQKLCPL